MPNNFNSELSPFKRQPSHKTRKGRMKSNDASVNEKTANWPDVPGKTQKRDRSGGVKKAKIYPTSKGL